MHSKSYLWLLVGLTACGADETQGDQDSGTSNVVVDEPIRLQSGNYTGPVRTTYDTCGDDETGTSEIMSMYVFGGMPTDYTCVEVGDHVECEDYEYYADYCAFDIYTTFTMEALSATELTGTLEWDLRVRASASGPGCMSCRVKMSVQMARE